MSIPLLDIDHLTLQVPNLVDGKLCYEKLGFTVSPRGNHKSGTSANHAIALPQGGYLELFFSWAENSEFDQSTMTHGAISIALTPKDSNALFKELGNLGIDCPEPRDFARPVSVADGVKEAKFRNITLPQMGPETMHLYSCEQMTPDLIWRTEWMNHANGAQTLTGAINVHPEPRVYADDLVRLYGEDKVKVEKNNVEIVFQTSAISIISPDEFHGRYPSIQLPPKSNSGWFAGAILKVSDLKKTTQVLEAEGVGFKRLPTGSLVVYPEFAENTVLEFHE